MGILIKAENDWRDGRP